MSIPPDSQNPYSSPTTVDQVPAKRVYLPGYCKTMFIIDLVLCCLRVPMVILGFVGASMITPDDPLAQTVKFELATGIAIVGFGILANIGLLLKKSWGALLGYLALVASTASIGTAVMQIGAQMDQYAEGSPERIGAVIGGGFVFMIRLALMGLYLAALLKFSAWYKKQPN